MQVNQRQLLLMLNIIAEWTNNKRSRTAAVKKRLS